MILRYIFRHILRGLEEIMASIQEVIDLATSQNQRLVNLQSVVDAEQLQIADALKKLQDIIDAGSGATPAQLQQVADLLTDSNQKLDAVTTDVAGTIPDVPVVS